VRGGLAGPLPGMLPHLAGPVTAGDLGDPAPAVAPFRAKPPSQCRVFRTGGGAAPNAAALFAPESGSHISASLNPVPRKAPGPPFDLGQTGASRRIQPPANRAVRAGLLINGGGNGKEGSNAGNSRSVIAAKTVSDLRCRPPLRRSPGPRYLCPRHRQPLGWGSGRAEAQNLLQVH